MRIELEKTILHNYGQKRPVVLEALVAIPGESQVQIHVDVDKVFLLYTEYPPDANRGFDIPPVRTIVHDSTETNQEPIIVFSRPILVNLPTPDFSMPYNVITLTCTVMALFFGSMFNALTRYPEPVLFNKT